MYIPSATHTRIAILLALTPRKMNIFSPASLKPAELPCKNCDTFPDQRLPDFYQVLSTHTNTQMVTKPSPSFMHISIELMEKLCKETIMKQERKKTGITK